MEEITEEAAELVERVAGLDIGKASLVCCVRTPDQASLGRRRQQVRTFATTTGQLLELRDWLAGEGVTRCVMEATSVYWKAPFYLLEDAIAECWLVNAREVKNVPGRPKTDKLDAVWLARLAEQGMVRPSFVPPVWQRELRDLCRYRRTLTQERTREKQRVEKLLEDTQIKLSAVISDIFGVSGRAMLDALIAGQRDPRALAQLARASMRAKISVLAEALTGHFRDHHGYLLAMMLGRIDALTGQIEALTSRIGEAIAPFAHQVAQLDEIPGIGTTGAQEIIAEIGVDMTRFPTPGHLVSWAKFAPTARQSAGKSKPGSTGKGNPWLGGALGEAVIGAARTGTTGSHPCAANASSSPSSNGSPARRSCSKTPPPDNLFHTRLRCAPPGAAARLAKLRFSIQSELLGRAIRSTCTNVSGICPECTQRTGVRPVLVPRVVPGTNAWPAGAQSPNVAERPGGSLPRKRESARRAA